MLDDEETSAIQAAVFGGDTYAWARLMAMLAEVEGSELDANAIYDCVDRASSAELPREVNALRCLDAAGALVRAQLAFNEQRGRKFEQRFGDARQLVATMAAQTGYDVADPAAVARLQSSAAEAAAQAVTVLTTTKPAARGCAVAWGVIVLVVLAVVGVIVLRGSTNLSIGGIESRGISTSRFGMPLHRVGGTPATKWRSIVDSTQLCRYAVGVAGVDQPRELQAVVSPDPRRSAVVVLAQGHVLYAHGCAFLPAFPPIPGTPPYEGDFVVGIDIPTGNATISAGGRLCRAVLRRYTDTEIVELGVTTLVGHGSTTVPLRPQPGETLVLNVRSCGVRVLA